ncbi:helicase/secretion neighborhood CpaE-like protein [Streptomyces zhaozhouensis]|uniref:Helicase/secretion neighborhood CpaE-like protein n=1 Tax=Streptomyces zhaozhouensis TaxID=1300267 RepID=A0A286DX13_9ACTN|nr:septum site-determining protein Ssd [Streptomyces zhaozhouensis]SOD63198.1 helicase/secretion neighborhood CpaE-like protein [Streptomyces zhaozhouensis]
MTECASVLILTEDEELLDDLLRLCAVAGAEAEVAHGAPPTAEQWWGAPLVLVGDDRALGAGERAGPGRRPGVLLVGRDLDDHRVWARGVALGVEQVLHLPWDETRLVDRIADAVEGPGQPTLTLGVLGGRGGAGSSSLACALAVTAARAGRRSVLVDADPLGGGLDVPFGGERTAGSRWPALLSARGRLSGTALDEALPLLHGVRLLSWDREGGIRLPVEAMRSVLASARRGGGVLVVDLPRAVDEAAAEALTQLDLGLLVVPGELRAMTAARRVVGGAGALVRDLRLVARMRPGDALPGDELARMLRLPLAGELPDEPGLSVAAEMGEPPGADPGGTLAAFCTALLDRAQPRAGAVA